MLLMRRVCKQKMYWALFCLTEVNIITRPNNKLKGYSVLLLGASVLAQFKVSQSMFVFSICFQILNYSNEIAM